MANLPVTKAWVTTFISASHRDAGNVLAVSCVYQRGLDFLVLPMQAAGRGGEVRALALPVGGIQEGQTSLPRPWWCL